MSASSSSSGLIFLAFIVFLIAARAYRTYRGMRFSEARTIFYIGFYFVFSAFVVGSSFYEGVPLLYAIPDAVVFAISGIWAYRFAHRRITFWKATDGSIYFKGGIVIYAIYIAALAARLAVDFIVTGASFFTFTPAQTFSQNALLGFTITDILLMFGVGLLVGRNLRLIKRYHGIKSGLVPIETV